LGHLSNSIPPPDSPNSASSTSYSADSSTKFHKNIFFGNKKCEKIRFSHRQLEGLSAEDIVDMLAEASTLDEQASIVHFLWLKLYR
jgi:hypothetical protein